MYNHIVAFFYRLAYYIVRFAFFFYYDIQFEGRENAPPKTESAIFASNHRSYLDPVLVAMGAPHPFNYIAKEELFKHKVFARFIWFMGAFPATWKADPNYDMLSEAVKRLDDFSRGHSPYRWKSWQREKRRLRAGSQKRKACHSCGFDFQFQQPALSQ